jgi:RNA 2',3'-cyclic 3'-phosphodiesterase
MVRCFIAIECNDAQVITGIRQVQGVLDSAGAQIKNVEPENIHLTLKFLGEISQSQVEEVANVVKSISFDPFRFKVEGVGAFPNLRRPSVIWAGIKEDGANLETIFNEIEQDLSRLGFSRESRSFNPHLTISRVRGGRNRAQLVEEILRLENFVFGQVLVEHVFLKKSVLTPQGPIYSNLAESRHS